MSVAVLSACLALLLLLLATPVPAVELSDVVRATSMKDLVEVTASNYAAVIANAPAEHTILLELFSPTCTACHRLLPELAKAASMLKKSDPHIVIAQLDLPSHKELEAVFDPPFYPYFYVFKGGRRYAFEDETADKAADFAAVMQEIAAPGWRPTPDGVVAATDATFAALLAKSTPTPHDLLLVHFHNSTCTLCQRLAPEFSRAARLLAERGVAATLATVDAELNPETARRYDVTTFPSLKVMAAEGHVVDFDMQAARSGLTIAREMADLVAPACMQLKGVADFEKFITLGASSAVLVGFVPRTEAMSAALLTIQAVGEHMRKRLPCAWTQDTKTIAAHATAGPSSITVFQPPRYHTKSGV